MPRDDRISSVHPRGTTGETPITTDSMALTVSGIGKRLGKDAHLLNDRFRLCRFRGQNLEMFDNR